ncbi:hypothetical protein DV515_00017541, partial [Chloebia gouldiae]
GLAGKTGVLGRQREEGKGELEQRVHRTPPGKSTLCGAGQHQVPAAPGQPHRCPSLQATERGPSQTQLWSAGSDPAASSCSDPATPSCSDPAAPSSSNPAAPSSSEQLHCPALTRQHWLVPIRQHHPVLTRQHHLVPTQQHRPVLTHQHRLVLNSCTVQFQPGSTIQF